MPLSVEALQKDLENTYQGKSELQREAVLRVIANALISILDELQKRNEPPKEISGGTF